MRSNFRWHFRSAVRSPQVSEGRKSVDFKYIENNFSLYFGVIFFHEPTFLDSSRFYLPLNFTALYGCLLCLLGNKVLKLVETRTWMYLSSRRFSADGFLRPSSHNSQGKSLSLSLQLTSSVAWGRGNVNCSFESMKYLSSPSISQMVLMFGGA